MLCWFFFFQAEDGIRDLVRSRGLGDVYKRQVFMTLIGGADFFAGPLVGSVIYTALNAYVTRYTVLSLIHI